MDGLSFEDILDDDEMSLFEDNGKPAEEESGGGNNNNNEHEEDTTDVDVDSLFGQQESVGGEEKNNKEQEEDTDSHGEGSSPNDLFSSIAQACAEEGIFPTLDEAAAKEIKTAEDFRKLMTDTIKNELTEQQQRVINALDAGVEETKVRQYEAIISQLNDIDVEELVKEGEENETLRKQLIYQDFINSGFDKARAERETNRAVANGTDLEDAKEALERIKKFYDDGYKAVINKAQEEKEQEDSRREVRAAKLKDDIFSDKSIFSDMELDNTTKQKMFDCISKPIYKDPKTGETYTAIQKFELEHSDEFLVKLAFFYTMTDGMKSLDGLVKGKVKQEMKKGFQDLEKRLNGSTRDSGGNLRFTSGVDDTESFLGKGMKLDI